jgi:hypothetical protein
VDASLTRDTLARLLIEENGALGEFEMLLEKEHGALASRDIDSLEALAEGRQASLIKLLKVEEERRSLCSMLGFDTDLAGPRNWSPGAIPRAVSTSATRNARVARRPAAI